jgi:outer membrane biosynthesis protein TonB
MHRPALRTRVLLHAVLGALLATAPAALAQEPNRPAPEVFAPAQPATPAQRPSAAPAPQTPAAKSPEQLTLEAAADQAIRFVLMHESLDPKAIVPKTGQPLPTNGTWSVDKQRPTSCPTASEQPGMSFLRVLYRVPNTDVSCEWVVLLRPGGFGSTILEQNADSVRYLLRTVANSEIRSMILTREMPQPPRDPTVQGTVELQVFVGPAGDPTRAYVVSGPEALRPASISAASQWHFKPLMAGTRAVPFETSITFQFNGTARVMSRP